LDYLNLFNRRIPVMESTSRGGQVTRVPFYWRKPVALLVNEWTRSGKELFAFGFRKYGYGPVVGARTSGAVLGARAFPIGGGGLLYLAVGTLTDLPSAVP
jgi:carboxyl-terminal processing protease